MFLISCYCLKLLIISKLHHFCRQDGFVKKQDGANTRPLKRRVGALFFKMCQDGFLLIFSRFRSKKNNWMPVLFAEQKIILIFVPIWYIKY
jgi:hypothetical protein